MGVVVRVSLAFLLACGHHDSSVDGGGVNGDGWAVSYGAPATMFSNETTLIERFQDLDGDGDYNEPGEQTVFYTSPTMLIGDIHSSPIAIDHATIQLLVSFQGSYSIQWLQDLDSNGDANGPGESRTWFSGTLPTGKVSAIVRGADGAIYARDEALPPTFYRLSDVNGDGDADDPGEAIAVSSPISAVQGDIGFTADQYGDMWFLNDSGMFSANLYRIHAGVVALAVDHTTFESQLALKVDAARRISATADGEILVSGRSTATDGIFGEKLAMVRDANADQIISSDEVTLAWNEDDGDFPCIYGDLQVLDDGSVMADSIGSTVIRMVDADHSRDFRGIGETYVAYDPEFITPAPARPLEGIAATTH